MARNLAILAVCVAGLLSTAAGQPTPDELLDKYEAIRGKFTSYRIEQQERQTLRGRHPGYQGPVDFRRWTEFCFDGKRSRIRTSKWGTVWAHDPPLVKGKGPYGERLWDGTQFYQYDHTQTPEPDDPGGQIYIRTRDTYAKHLPRERKKHANRIGFREKFFGDEDLIGERLRQAKRIRVRPRLETVRGSKCYVIEAVSPHGKYTVWLDPKHSYQIARARVEKIGDQALHLGKQQDKSSSTVATLEIERFEEIDGAWIPMEGVYKWTHRFGKKGEYFWTAKREYKRTKVTFSPDHEALKSFVPDYPEGPKVSYPKKMPGIEFKWKDGKIVRDPAVKYPAKLPGGEFRWEGEQLIHDPRKKRPRRRR